MRISDWSSDVCSSDLLHAIGQRRRWSSDQSAEGAAVIEQRARRGFGAALGQDCGPGSRNADALQRGAELRFWQVDIAHILAARPGKGRRIVGQGEALVRSEEHTSDLQSLMRLSNAVFCLKKKK